MVKKKHSELEKYRAECGKCERKMLKLILSKAIAYVREHRIAEPPWLHEAVYRFGRAQITGMRRTGRPTNVMLDDQLYKAIEDYRSEGLTQEEAFAKTAEDYAAELKPNRNRREGEEGEVETVKKAWLRHKKRIEMLEAESENSPFSFRRNWRVKDKYTKGHDKYAYWLRQGTLPPEFKKRFGLSPGAIPFLKLPPDLRKALASVYKKQTR